MQYRSGTVNLTNNSNIITGVSTEFIANIKVGDSFYILGDVVNYVVSQIDSDTQIRISTNYTGVTDTNVEYTVTRDFSPNYHFPLLSRGDINTAAIISRAINEIDTRISEYESPDTLTLTDGLNTSNININQNTSPSNKNALHIDTTGHFFDGGKDSGITVESYEPNVEFIDKSSGSSNFLFWANSDYFRLSSDPESDGSYDEIFTIKKDGYVNATSTVQAPKYVIKGSSNDQTNTAYTEFRNSDNSRIGFVGDAYTSDSNIQLKAEEGDLKLLSDNSVHISPTVQFKVTTNTFYQDASSGVYTFDNTNSSKPYTILNVQNNWGDPMLQLHDTSDGDTWKVLHDTSADTLRFQFNNANKFGVNSSGDLLFDDNFRIETANSRMLFQRAGVELLSLYFNGNLNVANKITKTGESFHSPIFTNGWTNFGSGHAQAFYYKDACGWVHLQGLVKSGTIGTAYPMFTLPVGYRPHDGMTHIFSGIANDVAVRIYVLSNGQVSQATGSNNWSTLDGISFYAG